MKAPSINGLDSLKALFPNEKVLQEYIIENCYFFDRETVKRHDNQIKDNIESNCSIPTYYSKHRKYYIKTATTYTPHRSSQLGNVPPNHLPLKSRKTFNNPVEAWHFSHDSRVEIYDIKTNLRVKFDKNRYDAVRDALWNYTNQSIKSNNFQTISNYAVVPIWPSDKLEEYSQLWRFILIPTPFNHLIDYKSKNNDTIQLIKLLQAITIELYPFNAQKFERKDKFRNFLFKSDEYKKEALEIISFDQIKYISTLPPLTLEEVLEGII